MATVAPSDQAADLLQKLSFDSHTKNALEIPEPTKKHCVDSGDGTNGQIQSLDRSVTPLLQDTAMCYLPSYASPTYYYGGSCEGNVSEWDEYSRYVAGDGVEMSAGVYGNSGSVMYHHGYGYAPYSSYPPAGTPVSHDGQLYGAQQHYQYPHTPYFQQPATGLYTTPAAQSAAAPAKGETVNSNARSTHQFSSFNSCNNNYGRVSTPATGSGYQQDPRFNSYDGIRSPIPWSDGPLCSDAYHPKNLNTSSITSSSISNNNGNVLASSRNQLFRPQSQLMGMHQPKSTGYMNQLYPNKLYVGPNQYGNNYRSDILYGLNNNTYDYSRTYDKFKPRFGRGNNNNSLFNYHGSENNTDGLNELNRGPRAKISATTSLSPSKNQKRILKPVSLVASIQESTSLRSSTNEVKGETAVIDRDEYNRPEFVVDNYVDAKFFIIKSYSEDDVHKSIKYNIWSSTQNGNKKLNAAYLEAHQNTDKCPVFLFFSVNTSGQFVGVAEMVGPVDFNKSVEYWQQDKWVGCFPVIWHFIKDVPNTLLKHITLENNENKSVTNSRDTQEVKQEQGLQLLKLFKDHTSKQCILDDFDFYEERQRRIQEKKSKQQQFQK